MPRSRYQRRRFSNHYSCSPSFPIRLFVSIFSDKITLRFTLSWAQYRASECCDAVMQSAPYEVVLRSFSQLENKRSWWEGQRLSYALQTWKGRGRYSADDAGAHLSHELFQNLVKISLCKNTCRGCVAFQYSRKTAALSSSILQAGLSWMITLLPTGGHLQTANFGSCK